MPRMMITSCIFYFNGIILWNRNVLFRCTKLTIINEAFTPKQGIRIYPIITLAPVLGGIIGGFLLQFLPELIGTRGLIYSGDYRFYL